MGGRVKVRTRSCQVFVDARQCSLPLTGVGQFCLSVLEHWPANVPTPVSLTAGSSVPELPEPAWALNCGRAWPLVAAAVTLVRGGSFFSPASFWVPALLGKRAVLTVHDVTPLTHPQWHNRRAVLGYKVAFRFAVRRVAKVIVPTRATANELIKLVPSAAAKLVIVSYGPKPIREPVEAPKHASMKDLYALYVGTVEPRKNVVPLVRAFLAAAPPDWHLHIAGSLGWLDSNERAEFLRLCTNPRVTHHGYVTEAELERLYRSTSIFCYVSGVEGFGLPVLEAMTYGLPVVHSDDPAIVEVAGGAGYTVGLGNLDADLRESFRTLTRDPGLRQQLTASSLERARHFSWDTTSQAIANAVHVASTGTTPVS